MNLMTNSPAQTCKALLMTLTLSLMMFSVAYAGWEEGVAAFKVGNFKLAAKEFKAATVQNPDTWGYHFMLGVTLPNVGKKELALQHLQKAYDLNPNDLSFKSLLAAYDLNPNDLAYDLNPNELSLKTGLESALREKGAKQNAALQYLFGATALLLGMKDEGTIAIKKAQELDPKQNLYRNPLSRN